MSPRHVQLADSTLRGVLKRLHYPLEVMRVCVRWYAAYPLSLRHLEGAIKRKTRPMLGFKSFWSAHRLLAGIETMHLIRKGQMVCPEDPALSDAEQFYSLAF